MFQKRNLNDAHLNVIRRLETKEWTLYTASVFSKPVVVFYFVFPKALAPNQKQIPPRNSTRFLWGRICLILKNSSTQIFISEVLTEMPVMVPYTPAHQGSRKTWLKPGPSTGLPREPEG